MTPSNYRRSKSLATDVARWWKQLKIERGKYLDEIPTLARLVKSLLTEALLPEELVPTTDTSTSPPEQRISLVKILQEKCITMKDAVFETERILYDIMGNDLVKPLAPERAIEQVRKEEKQLDLLLMAAKNYIKVRNRIDRDLKEEKQFELVKSARDALEEAFRTIQDQILNTEKIINTVYDEMTKQRELADLLEKKQLL